MKRSRKKGSHGEGEMSEAWLLPYSDLMTLLLAVFIVLFVVSHVDQKKSEALAEAFQGIFKPGSKSIESEIGDTVVPDLNFNNPSFQEADEAAGKEMLEYINKTDLSKMSELQNTLKTYFGKQGMSESVLTKIDERGLVISLNDSILFDSGSADIKEKHEEILKQIGNTIGASKFYIRVEGHTDNFPIHTSAYPSNWELSSARSSRVVRFFADQCGIDPERLVSVGYSEFKPEADNNTAEGRAKNRRVDIIVLNTKFNSLEDQISDVHKLEQ